MRRKMKGKALVILMALAMIFTVMPMMSQEAYAEPTQLDIDNLSYLLNDNGTALLSGYDEQRPPEVIEIPATIEHNGVTYKVTGIGDSALSSCEKLTTITIPKNVTSIGDSAFSFSGLKSITFENESNLKSIGNYAFDMCESLTSITIPNSVTSIGERALAGCKNLTTITIPNSVTSIGECAFYESGLEGIVFENGSNLKKIEKEAFSLSKSLKTITIPQSVTSIGEGAFAECENLKAITIPKSVTSIGDRAFEYAGLKSVAFENGCGLANIGYCVFNGCKNLTSITIPKSVTSIRNMAFSYSGLKSITFEEGSSLKSIGNSAFSVCESLTSITIPKSVTSIGSFVFWESGLKSVTFERGSDLKSIGEEAFSLNKSLKTITIPRSVTKIEKKAFDGCKTLETLYFRGTEPEWNRMPGRSSKWSGDQKIKVVCLIKAANPLKVKARTATVKYSRLKKQDQTLAVNKVIRFTKKGKGRMTYIKASGSKKITISKRTGKVTVRKGLKKGTYRIKVKVKAAGNVNYKASAWKTVTFRVRVK